MYQKRDNKMEIITLFRVNYKAQFYLRQISKLSGLPLKTCQNAITSLENNRILKGRVEGKNKYFTLNLDNIQTKSLLLQAEIYATDKFLAKNPQFNSFLKSVNTNISIIVFGSFAKGNAKKTSDIDLLVLADKKQELPHHLLPLKLHEVKLSEESFINALKKNETLIKEVEENHIILNNHSFYVNALWDYYGNQRP